MKAIRMDQERQEFSDRLDARIRTMNAIITEVERQNELKNEDQLAWPVYELASNPLLNLSEEVALVVRAINEGKNANLVEELTQVAAIAAAWLEGLYYKKPKEEGSN